MFGHAVFGLIVGLVARAFLPGRQHMGLIPTMILGLVGAWLGGLIGRMTGMYECPRHPTLVKQLYSQPTARRSRESIGDIREIPSVPELRTLLGPGAFSRLPVLARTKTGHQG